MGGRRTVHVASLGCKVSQYDGEALAGALCRAGWRWTAPEAAELIVLNTCTVTGRADADARKLLRRLRAANPGARFVITGCLAERDAQALEGLEGVELVVGNAGKAELARRLAGGEPETEGLFVGEIGPPRPGRSRAFLKVQEGCEQRCAYCIVPAVRGRERSLPVARALEEIARLVALGYPEVVLCGVHLGAYGRERGESLAELLRAAARLPGRFRLRLSSLEPWGVDDDLLAAVAGSDRVVPHLHLPLQSGCDATLRRMRRPYTSGEFARLLERARRAIPDLTVGTDLIVGYPGENDREFEATLRFLESQPIDLAHVFTFSPRTGTPAAAAAAPPQRVAKERLRAVQRLFAARRRAWLERHVGRRLEVVTLGVRGGRTRGLAATYAPVAIEGELPEGRLVEVEATAVAGGTLAARPAV